MKTRKLGTNGPEVSALTLGCRGMSDLYGGADRHEPLATIHQALSAGVTLLDTGDFYGMGHNESLLAEALRSHRREDVVLRVKTGMLRGPRGEWFRPDARPEALKNFVAYSLGRLGTDYIDIVRPARVDPAVPIEESVGALKDLLEAGVVRHIGLSEVSAETLRRAYAVHPISDVQIEYSLLSRRPEDELIPTCKELGVSITAYGVLSRGLLSGHWTPERSETSRDFRAILPRFHGENLQQNLALVEALRGVAESKGASVAQIAIAWVLSRGGDIVPLVGARSRPRLSESLGAVAVTRTDADLAQIEQAVPKGAAAGTRYAEGQMAMLDSER